MCKDVSISVIVPIYNAERYLGRCIDSILNQTYKNLDIILINDGSTDSSLSIIKKYELSDCRVRVVDKVNQGLVRTRKVGASIARGEYVVWVDADDWIEPNMIEELANAADDSDIVTSGTIREYGNHAIVDNENIPSGTYEGEYLKNELHQKLITLQESIKLNIPATIWNKMIKTDLLRNFENAVPDEVVIGEDLACTYPCILNAKKIVVTGKNYYHYCIRPNTMVASDKQDKYYPLLFSYLKSVFDKAYKDNSIMTQQYKAIKFYYYLLKNQEKCVYWKGQELVPFGKLHSNSNILIYGAGKFGIQIREYLKREGLCNIVGWVDKSFKNTKVVDSVLYDKILVAVIRQELIVDIKAQLIRQGVPEEKILLLNCKKYIDSWRG